MNLVWDVRFGYGYLDITPREYDEAYFKKYVGYAKTAMGQELTRRRVDFVNRWHQAELLDVGVGSGQFVKARPNTWGYDINPVAIKMLSKAGLYADMNRRTFPAYSFFDSFEHIKSHELFLKGLPSRTKLFLSIPTFTDIQHVFRSKHYRPDEHYWYFTAVGLMRYLSRFGFSCLEVDDFEIRLGREDILTFAFEKR